MRSYELPSTTFDVQCLFYSAVRIAVYLQHDGIARIDDMTGPEYATTRVIVLLFVNIRRCTLYTVHCSVATVDVAEGMRSCKWCTWRMPTSMTPTANSALFFEPKRWFSTLTVANLVRSLSKLVDGCQQLSTAISTTHSRSLVDILINVSFCHPLRSCISYTHDYSIMSTLRCTLN